MTSSRLESPAVRSALEDALRALARAFSAMQLYLPNNQQRAQRLSDARQAFAQLWRIEDAVEVEVREAALVFDEAPVYQDVERGSDTLPWLLYRDGVRSLTFSPGFEESDLEPFLQLLQDARQANSDDDDLVTLLWVADFRGLSYRFLDSYGVNTVPKTGDRPTEHGHLSLPVTEQTVDPPAESPFIKLSDADSALYFLDRRELDALQAALADTYAQDPRRPVLDGLLDRIEDGLPTDALLETISAIDRLVVELLIGGEYELVAHTLHESTRLATASSTEPDVAAALETLAGRLSEPKAMAQLLLAIDESTRTPSTAVLEALFRELRASALEPLVLWLGTASASAARAGVERACLRLAGAHVSEVARLLDHEDVGVIRGALKVATQLASPATVPAIARLLRHEETRMRLEAVNALAAIGSPGAMQALERAIDDREREVRVATYRTVAHRKHPGALPRLLTMLRAKESRSADLGEKMALFEAFGSLCGDAGVAELDALLNNKGLLGAKEPPEFRACAARALGLIGTPNALAALQRASDTKEVVVRSAVQRALREGT